MKLKEMHFAARLLLSLYLCFVAQWACAAPAVISISADHTPVAAGEAFSLTVTYGSDMDTTVNPAFTFPTSGEDPSGFLTATTAGWRDSRTFTQNYQAQFVSLVTNTIDVAVNGAKDTIGTAQLPGFQANVFDVVMYIPAPRVVDMNAFIDGNDLISPAGVSRLITAADVGRTVQFFVRYTIATDYDGCGNGVLNHLCPDLVFTNTGGTPRSLTNLVAQWQSRTLYKVTWTIADGDEQFDSIDIKVAGGVGRRDDTNIKNTDVQLTGVFSIDTSHPTVTSVTTSATSITSTSPASGLFTLTAAYSKPMDTTSTPTFSFPNQSLGATVSATSGSWSDSTHFVQTFKVSGTGVSFSGVDVKVSGGRNPHGNLQRERTVTSVFGINLVSFGSLTPLLINIPGVSTWPGAMDTSCCDDMLVRILSQALNMTLTRLGQSGSGTVVLGGYLGARLAFVVTAVSAGDTRAEGLYPVGDGQYQVVSGGIAATIVPAVVDLAQLARALPQGSTIEMEANGVLTANVGGITYVVQPGVVVQQVANTEGRPMVTMGGDGFLHFTDTAGNSQILYPAFLEPKTLLNGLRALDNGATLGIQLDGTARAALFGRPNVLVPDVSLNAVPANRTGQNWWQDTSQHFIFLNLQHPNTAQGFAEPTTN